MCAANGKYFFIFPSNHSSTGQIKPVNTTIGSVLSFSIISMRSTLGKKITTCII